MGGRAVRGPSLSGARTGLRVRGKAASKLKLLRGQSGCARAQARKEAASVAQSELRASLGVLQSCQRALRLSGPGLRNEPPGTTARSAFHRLHRVVRVLNQAPGREGNRSHPTRELRLSPGVWHVLAVYSGEGERHFAPLKPCGGNGPFFVHAMLVQV